MTDAKIRWGRAKGTPNKTTEITRKIFEEAFELCDYNPFVAQVYAAQICLDLAENATIENAATYLKAFNMLNKVIIDKFIPTKTEIEVVSDVDLIALAPKVIVPKIPEEEEPIENKGKTDD